MKRLFLIILILFSALFLNSCWQTDISSSENLISGSIFPPGSSVSLNSVLSGSVSSEVVESTEVSTPLGSYVSSGQTRPLPRVSSTSNSCRTSSFETHLVGGDGTAISDGSATAGYFSASVNDGHEVILEFDCGMRCIGKPGSSDLICDALSNSILSALEHSLQSTISTDPLLDGLSIAKIVEGVGETLKLMSILDPTNSLADSLAEAETAEERAEIISASALGPLFEAITTMAIERRAYNYAVALGMTHEEALAFAAAASWSTEKVVKMMVGLGLHVRLDLDGADSIYNQLFTVIDTLSDTTFIAELRTYIMTLYEQVYENNETSSVTIVCRARNQDTGDKIIYPPYKSGSQLACYDAGSSSETDAMGVTKNSGTEENDDWSIEAFIKPSTVEANRNDPLGLYSRYSGRMSEYSVSVVDVFQEFMDAMLTPVSDGGCGDYITIGDNGPTAFAPEFATCISNLGYEDYFSGMIGIYKFMRNRELREVKFTLNELYDAVVGSDYMAIRIGVDLWQVGLDNSKIEFRIPQDNGGTFRGDMIPYQLYETGTASWGGPTYSLECVDGSRGTISLCDDDTPKTGPISATVAEYVTLVNTYVPSFNAIFGDYTSLPSMEEIRNYIFKSAHHMPYNVAGSKTFQVLGNESDNNAWEADAPIMCRFNNASAAGEFIVGTSSVTCAEASSVTWDEEGNPSDVSTYASYYALQDRGHATGEDDQDRYYSLINISNGAEYNLNGRPFRVRGIKALYTPSDSPTINGTTVHPKTQEFCDRRENDDGDWEVQCWTDVFSYVAVSFPNDWYHDDYYWPYTWNVPMQFEYWDEDIESYIQEEWEMPIAMTRNNTLNDHSDDRAVCIKVGEEYVDTTPDGATSTDQSIVHDLTDDISNAFVDCFNNSETNFYYLYPSWGANNKAVQWYHMVRNDGIWMRNDASPDGLISQARVEAALGKTLGPTGSSHWLNHFEVANLSHDPKFDPYCDDENGDGECSCTDEDGDGECTLADTFTEATLSEPPFWPNAPNVDQIKITLQTCGGESGAALINCLAGLYIDHSINILNLDLDWNDVLECENSDKTMNWVDVDGIKTQSSPEGFYGKGCGSSDNDYMGRIRMKKIIRRDNAYDIARPNSVMKLISTATASTGTGVDIDPDAELFSFQEALAFAYMRLIMPIYGEISYNGANVEGIGLFFERADMPNKNSRLASGLLRKFMEKGGVITER